MAFVPKHQTLAEFAARWWALVRADYQQNKPRWEARIAWIYDRVQDGSFTSNQVRLSLNAVYGKNITAVQWNDYVTTKLLPVVNRYKAREAEADL